MDTNDPRMMPDTPGQPPSGTDSVIEPKAMTIGKLVHQRVQNACKPGTDSEVATAVIERMAQESINKRTEALLTCFNELEKAQKAVKKAEKPDQHIYTQQGEKVSQYTNDQWKTLQDARAKVEQIDKAIDEALLKADYSKAFELAAKAGNK